MRETRRVIDYDCDAVYGMESVGVIGRPLEAT